MILTFNGDLTNDAQVAHVRGLGITSGYRMNKLPIMAVNASPWQIKQLARAEFIGPMVKLISLMFGE